MRDKDSTKSGTVEIAYRMPGKEWKRTTCRESALERKLEKLSDAGAEVQVRRDV